jgi:phosphoglycolate phosphatase-like HAD superfamily hydrolase
VALKKLEMAPNEVLFVGHQRYEMEGARKAHVKTVSLVKNIGEDIFVENISKIINAI